MSGSQFSSDEEKIRAAVEAGNIKMMSSDRIDAYGDFAYEFLDKMFDITVFFVSDESTLGDFATCLLTDEDLDLNLPNDIMFPMLDQRIQAKAFDLYGIHATIDDTLADVLDRIFQNKPSIQ